MQRFRNRRVSDITEVVELADGAARRDFEAIPIPCFCLEIEKCAEIDADEITHRDVFAVVWQCDFGAKVR